jgi:hypothetical protein
VDTVLTASVVCGMFGVLVLLFLARILRVRRGRGAGRVVVERLAEMDDWFNPGRRRQLDQERLVATARIDARTGDGDPLDRFSDAAELRRRRETSVTREIEIDHLGCLTMGNRHRAAPRRRLPLTRRTP